jgi:transposase-like protein
MEESIMGLSRRQFSREFKLAALQRLERGSSVGEVARAFEINPNMLHRWRQEFRQGPGNAFAGAGQRRWEEGRVAELERKIGQQAHAFLHSLNSASYPFVLTDNGFPVTTWQLPLFVDPLQAPLQKINLQRGPKGLKCLPACDPVPSQ